MAVSEQERESSSRDTVAEASVCGWCFLQTSFMTDLVLYSFCLKIKPSVRRETVIKNIFGVNFVHCSELLK